jgi:membrane-bound inhibitor of C-type lysozyme
MEANAWSAGTKFIQSGGVDARYGSLVKPSVDNGFWYLCTAAKGGTETISRQLQQRRAEPGGPHRGRLRQDHPADFQSVEQQRGRQHRRPVQHDHPLLRATGTTEPVWPTEIDATVTDGQLTWKAVRAHYMSGTVYGVTNRATFNSQDIAAAEAKYFQYGYLTWTGGKNAGLSCEISDHTVSGTMAFLTLLEPAAYPISIGHT